MAKRRILQYPDPRLREVSKPVEGFDYRLRSLVSDMVSAMYGANGAGLAAIQIGEPVCVIVLDAETAGRSKDSGSLVLVNPRLTWLSEETYVSDEGCLSFQGRAAEVKRSVAVKLEAQDERGNVMELAVNDFRFARALQHEIDHLNAILIIDHGELHSNPRR